MARSGVQMKPLEKNNVKKSQSEGNMRKDYVFKSLVPNWVPPPIRLCIDVHTFSKEGGSRCDYGYYVFSVCGRYSYRALYG